MYLERPILKKRFDENKEHRYVIHRIVSLITETSLIREVSAIDLKNTK